MVSSFKIPVTYVYYLHHLLAPLPCIHYRMSGGLQQCKMLNVKNKAMKYSKNQHWKLRNVMKYYTILTTSNLLTVYFATVNHEFNALVKKCSDNSLKC